MKTKQITRVFESKYDHELEQAASIPSNHFATFSGKHFAYQISHGTMITYSIPSPTHIPVSFLATRTVEVRRDRFSRGSCVDDN